MPNITMCTFITGLLMAFLSIIPESSAQNQPSPEKLSLGIYGARVEYNCSASSHLLDNRTATSIQLIQRHIDKVKTKQVLATAHGGRTWLNDEFKMTHPDAEVEGGLSEEFLAVSTVLNNSELSRYVYLCKIGLDMSDPRDLKTDLLSWPLILNVTFGNMSENGFEVSVLPVLRFHKPCPQDQYICKTFLPTGDSRGKVYLASYPNAQKFQIWLGCDHDDTMCLGAIRSCSAVTLGFDSDNFTMRYSCTCSGTGYECIIEHESNQGGLLGWAIVLIAVGTCTIMVCLTALSIYFYRTETKKGSYSCAHPPIEINTYDPEGTAMLDIGNLMSTHGSSPIEQEDVHDIH